MREGSFRTQVFSLFARIGKALASPARLELVYLLAQGEKSVEQLAHTAGLSMANASQHLQTLKTAQLVESRREGQKIWYRLASAQVEALWVAVQHLGEERLPEVRELSRAHEGLRESPAPMTASE
ncbi:MAG: metalloregulator ArsR/SmtB family transcription factor, partial [Deltaproteobacteria bacterium]|nr:metalloregulator ArsR/SmtB family transcription factor [Deltaproteobacteria bacterium]